MAETPSNDRVTTRDLILGLHGKVDTIDGRLRSVEMQLATDAGERVGESRRTREARRLLDRRTVTVFGLLGIVMQLPAWLVLVHAGTL